jgi:hypothetical protein
MDPKLHDGMSPAEKRAAILESAKAAGARYLKVKGSHLLDAINDRNGVDSVPDETPAEQPAEPDPPAPEPAPAPAPKKRTRKPAAKKGGDPK